MEAVAVKRHAKTVVTTPPILAKCPGGIQGLDVITGGGLARGRPTLVCGASGSGGTLFGMQFLVRGIQDHGERGVFMCFEERQKDLAENVGSSGFDLPALIAEKKLVDYTVIIPTLLFCVLGNFTSTPATAAEVACAQLPAISGTSRVDQSNLIQDYISCLGPAGGTVYLPAGTIYAEGLSLSNNVTIAGQGEQATTLSLPKGEHAPYLIASSTYVNGSAWVNEYGGIRDLTLDGSNATVATALLILQAWRFTAERCGVDNSPLHGIMLTDLYKAGSEDMIRHCHFDNNKGAGFYGQSVHGDIADGFIQDSVFNNNGSAGYYQIHLERAAGFHIVNNQTYSSPTGELLAGDAAVMEIVGNNFDGTGNRYSTVSIFDTGGWGTIAINGNIIHTQATAAAPALLSIVSDTANGGASITGNGFYSSAIQVQPIFVSGPYSKNIIAIGNSFSPNTPNNVALSP